MPSTYSSLKIELMATGEKNTTWGNITNINLGTALEEAIVGSADVTFASGDVTLTLTDTNATQAARNVRLRCTGTTGGVTRNLVVPSIEKPYIVRNDCADSIVVKTAAGTGITVPAGKTMWVYTDGTNVVDAVTHLSSLTLTTALPVAQGGTGVTTSTGTGSVVLSNSPTLVTPTLGAASATSIAAGLGAVGTPSYTFTGDTNTGMWSPAADTIAFSEGGVEAMRINSSGNVGIGTTTPETLLDLAGSQIARGDASGYVYFAPKLGTTPFGTNFDRFEIRVETGAQVTSMGNTHGGTGSPRALAFLTGGSERMRLDSSGNVGIGTSSPNAKLDVAGDIIASSQIISATAGTSTIAYTFGGQTVKTGMGCPADGTLSFYAGAATERMRLDSSGNVGIGTTSPAHKLDVVGSGSVYVRARSSDTTGAAIGYVGAEFAGGSTLQMRAGLGYTYLVSTGASDPLLFGTNNIERMRLDSSGNVGIGTTSPSALLDVNGAARANSLTLTTDLAIADGGTGASTASAARTNLGATTVGGNIFTLTNPSAITFLRLNADNTVSALNAADFRTAIGVGTGTGTVTSVSGTGTVNGITLTGTVTSSGSLTLGGTLSGVSLTTQVTDTLPIANGGTGATTAGAALTSLGAYPASNPNGFTSNAGTVTSVSGTGTVNGLTLTGTVTSSGNLTLGGTLSGVSLTTAVTGTLPVANGGTGTATAFTLGSVVFAGASGTYSQDNANFFWDDTNNRLGIGTNSPNVSLDVVGGIRARGGAPGAGGANNNGYAFNGTGDTDSGMFSSADGQLEFYTNNGERLRINSTGGITSSNLADAVGYKGLPQNPKTASYTLALTDMGYDIYITGTTAAQTITIPANASVAFPNGTMIQITNDSNQNWSIAITTDTLLWSPNNVTGTRTLAPAGQVTVRKVSATRWWISGVGLT